MNSIRVLHFIHSLSGGGAEQQLCQLIAHQQPGVEHWVACVKREPQAVKLDSTRTLTLGVSAKDPRVYGAALSAVRRLQPDVVHAWLPASIAIPAMVAGWLLRRKVVFSYRNQMEFHRLLNYPEYLVALTCARSIVSNSAANHRKSGLFAWLFQRKQGRVVHNCVVLRTQQRWELPATGDANAPLRLLFAGRLVHQKNLESLLHALSLLLDDGHHFELTVLGEGELQANLQQQAVSLGLADRVVFKGFCPNIHDWMLKADLLVFPSWYEGMPNVLVEAMAIGLPCLFSDIPAHRELVRDYDARGWFDPADSAQLAARIRAILADRSILTEMSSTGLDIAARFNVNEMVGNYEKVYRSLR